MLDQKSSRIVRLLVEEIVPLFGVLEALLSDRSTNLLSYLMLVVCQMLGIKKLNTTAYHPQCDGIVERYKRTMKAMPARPNREDQFGMQWDTTLLADMWAYRNMPHESTGKKSPFLLLGIDYLALTEAALFPPTPVTLTDIGDYREELVMSLSSAREAAAKSIQQA